MELPRLLNKQSGVLFIFGVCRFVAQLATFHQRNADEKEQQRVGDGSGYVPGVLPKAGCRYVDKPYAPPHHHFAEIVRMPSVLPQSYIAHLSWMFLAEGV